MTFDTGVHQGSYLKNILIAEINLWAEITSMEPRCQQNITLHTFFMQVFLLPHCGIKISPQQRGKYLIES